MLRRQSQRVGDGLTSWGVLVGSGGVTLAVGLLGLAIGLGSLVVVGALSVFFLVFLFVVIGLGLGAVSRLGLGLGLGLAVGLIALFGFLILFLIGILLALFLFFDATSLVSSGDVPIGRAWSARGHVMVEPPSEESRAIDGDP